MKRGRNFGVATRGHYAVIQPASKLFITGFDCFHQADRHRRRMPTPDEWFVMRDWFPDRGWLEYDTPLPRQIDYHRPYRGQR